MYGKVFSSIFNSTLVADGGWLPTYIFMSMIAIADKDGVVDVAPKALFRKLGFREYDTKVTFEEFQKAIDYLQSEDPESNSPTENGRRLIPMSETNTGGNRGWLIVNYLEYRKKASKEEPKGASTERVRKFRMRNAGLSPDDNECAYCGANAVGPDHIIATSNGGLNVPENTVPCCSRCNNHKASRTLVAFIEDPFVTWVDLDRILKNQKLIPHVTGLKRTKRPNAGHTDTDTDTDTDSIKEKEAALLALDDGKYKTMKTFLTLCKQAGVKPVPEDNEAWKYAEKMKIPPEMVRTAWYRFKHKYLGSKKKYIDWRQTFANVLRDNWYKIWWFDANGNIAWTSAGQQHRLAMQNNVEADL